MTRHTTERLLFGVVLVALGASSLAVVDGMSQAHAQAVSGFFEGGDDNDAGDAFLETLPRSGPDSYCNKTAVQLDITSEIFAEMMDALPDDWTYARKLRHVGSIEIGNLTTTTLDTRRLRFSCHLVVVMEDGRRIPGTFTKWATDTGVDAKWTPDAGSAPR